MERSMVHRLPERVWVPLYARLRGRDGWGAWRLVGELRRSGAQVEVRIDERNAVCRPAWAALAANDNGRTDERRGVAMQFGTCVPGVESLVLGEVTVAGSLLGEVRDIADAQRAAYRRGLKGQAHRSVASNWPDASRLAPRGKKDAKGTVEQQ